MMPTRLFMAMLMVLISLPSARSFALDDKAAHFGVSALFGAGAETFLHHRTDFNDVELVALGTLLGSLPGLGKEIFDSQQNGNEFSGRDLAADVAGAFSGALLSNLFNNAIEVRFESAAGRSINLVLGKHF